MYSAICLSTQKSLNSWIYYCCGDCNDSFLGETVGGYEYKKDYPVSYNSDCITIRNAIANTTATIGRNVKMTASATATIGFVIGSKSPK